MVSATTVACGGLATNRKSRLGEMASDFGLVTGGGAGAGGGCTTGVVASAVRLPLPGSTVKLVMLPSLWLATYRNGSRGDMAKALGPAPVLKMLGGFTGCTMLLLTGTERLPLLLLMSSKVRLSPEKSAI